ncbi:hypothetical protein D3C84_636370 [compost metagenome]
MQESWQLRLQQVWVLLGLGRLGADRQQLAGRVVLAQAAGNGLAEDLAQGNAHLVSGVRGIAGLDAGLQVGAVLPSHFGDGLVAQGWQHVIVQVATHQAQRAFGQAVVRLALIPVLGRGFEGVGCCNGVGHLGGHLVLYRINAGGQQLAGISRLLACLGA